MAWWLTYWPIVAMLAAVVLATAVLSSLLFRIEGDEMDDMDVVDDDGTFPWAGLS